MEVAINEPNDLEEEPALASKQGRDTASIGEGLGCMGGWQLAGERLLKHICRGLKRNGVEFGTAILPGHPGERGERPLLWLEDVGTARYQEDTE